MFTYVKLKNFLSFGDVTFNFKKNAKTAKPLIAVYGENGSGKSNFVKSFDLLTPAMISFTFVKSTETFSARLSGEEDTPTNELIRRVLRETDMEYYLASCRMADCDEPTEVEFGFLLDGHEGYYRLAFTDRIIGETLYSFTGRQRGKLFDICSAENGEISASFWSGLFPESQAEEGFKLDIRKYWGKHTFLGIVVKTIYESNVSYIANTISEYLIKAMDVFMDTSVIHMPKNVIKVETHKKSKLLPALDSGEIDEADLPQLERSERILRDFFTQTYADIKDVHYEYKATEKKKLKYQLYVDKMIAGEIRHLSFEAESSGTKKVLSVVRTLIGVLNGDTVICDEIDNGIHDLLLTNMIASLPDEIPGQLIFTTHNTMLLEELSADSVYVIDVDYLGNKDVHCVAEFPVQRTHNKRLQYLKGLYGGTPYLDGIDYDSMMEEFSGEDGEES